MKPAPEPPAIVSAMLVTGIVIGTILTCILGAIAALTVFQQTLGTFGVATLASAAIVLALGQAWQGQRWAIWASVALAVAVTLLVEFTLLQVWVIAVDSPGADRGLLSVSLGVIALGVGAVAVCFVIGLSQWARQMRRYRRDQAMQCRGCGYDLRGNHDASACPECGAARDLRARVVSPAE